MLTHYLSDDGPTTACGINAKESQEVFMVTGLWRACDCPACLEHKPAHMLGPLNPPDPALEETLEELEGFELPEPEGVLDGLADAVEEWEHEKERDRQEITQEVPYHPVSLEFKEFGDAVRSSSLAPTAVDDLDDFRTPYKAPVPEPPPIPKPPEKNLMTVANPRTGVVYYFTLDTVPDFAALDEDGLVPEWSVYECSCGGFVKAPDSLLVRINGQPCPHCKNGFIWWLKGYSEVPCLPEPAPQGPVPVWTGAEQYTGTSDMNGSALRLVRNMDVLLSRIPNVDMEDCPYTNSQAIHKSIWIVEKAVAYIEWLDAMHLQLLVATGRTF